MPDDLPSNVALVCEDNFAKFYGPVYANRAQFAAGRYIIVYCQLYHISTILNFPSNMYTLLANEKVNINSAYKWELCLIRGVGPQTASDIIAKRKERPFEGEMDLLRRVKFPRRELSQIEF